MSEDYKEVPYTIEMDWKGENVWLNNHVSKERLVITEKDAESISDAFRLLKMDRLNT